MFAANGDAIAVNATGVEITPGCAPAFIEAHRFGAETRVGGVSNEFRGSSYRRGGRPPDA
jgi:hypothetical protein